MDRDRGVMGWSFFGSVMFFTVCLIYFFGLSPMFFEDTNHKAITMPTFHGEKPL